MAFEGLQGAVSRGASAGADVIRATTGRMALSQRDRELKAGQAQARLDNMFDLMNKDREQSIQEAGLLAQAAIEMKKNGMEGTPEYEQTVQGIQAALMSHGVRLEGMRESAIAGGLDPQIVAQGASGSDFVDRNMSVFTAQIDAAQQESEILTGEALEALIPGLPEGSVVQRDKGKLTFFFNPTDNPSAKQEQFDFLKRSGNITDEQAAGIVGGRFVVLADPVTREGSVFDKATGENISAEEPPEPTGEVPSLVPTGIETGQATGVPGLARQAFNTLVGAFNVSLPKPKAQEAANALETLQTFTSITMQAEVPGRPSQFLLEKLDRLSVKPNSIFQGEELAKSRLRQTKQVLDGEIARITSIVLPQDLDPKTRVETNINLTSLERLSEAYGALLAGFDRPATDVPEGVSAEDAAQWHLYSDEVKALILKQVKAGGG